MRNRMVRGLLVTLIVVTICPATFSIVTVIAAYGQVLHATGPLPSFEVATIKPGESPFRRNTQNEVFVNGESIRTLIRTAYNLPAAKDRVLGEPNWLGKDEYCIDAKIEDSVAAALQKMPRDKRDEQIHLMEQSLLADRVKLKAHFEMREMPVYDLVVAKGGSKLIPAKNPMPTGVKEAPRYGHPEDVQKGVMISPRAGSSITKMKFIGETLQEFAYVIMPYSDIDGRTIVDHTGLAGAYDFSVTLKWNPAEQAGDDDPGSIFTALQEQLGLKLTPGKDMVEVLVIDSIERPSEN